MSRKMIMPASTAATTTAAAAATTAATTAAAAGWAISYLPMTLILPIVEIFN